MGTSACRMATASRCQASAGDTASPEGAGKRPCGSLCTTWPCPASAAGSSRVVQLVHTAGPACCLLPALQAGQQAASRTAQVCCCCPCGRTSAAHTWSAVYLVPTDSLQVCHEFAVLMCSSLCVSLLRPCSSPVEVSKTCACSSCPLVLVPYRYVTYWLEVTKTHTIAPPRTLRVHQLVLRGLPQNLVHHAAITLGSRAIDGPIQPAAQYVFSLQPRNDLKLGGPAGSLSWPVGWSGMHSWLTSYLCSTAVCVSSGCCA